MKPALILSLFTAACLALVPVTSSAQDAPKKDALAAQLLDELQIRKMLDSTFDSIPKMQGQMLGKTDMTPTQKAAFDKTMARSMEAVKQAMDWDTIKPIFVRIYADNFDASDLEGMIAFYKTPVGQKWIEKQPAVQQATVQAMSGIMPKIQAAMMKSLSEPDDAAAPTPTATP